VEAPEFESTGTGVEGQRGGGGWFRRCRRRREDDDDNTVPSGSTATAMTGSSVLGATFNLTNGIVGAGVIGLGGAMALSGGLISIVFIIVFALLTKLALDLLIDLTIRNSSNGVGSYEELGLKAYGTVGRLSVLTSKMFYSYGGLVAFVVIVKDNFGSGLRGLIYGEDEGEAVNWFLRKDGLLTVSLVANVILPLSLLRDMTPLAKFSIFSVLAFCGIVVIVVVLFFVNPDGEVRLEGEGAKVDWLEVHGDVFESLGTFVTLYVCQNFAHLTYESIDPKIRNIKTWKKVSTNSLTIAGVVSLIAGIFVYMTFWRETKSDIFDMYPSSVSVDISKLLLCVTMLLTFPIPFFTCREIVVLVALDCYYGCGCCSSKKKQEQNSVEDDVSGQLRAPLLEAGGLEEGNEWGVKEDMVESEKRTPSSKEEAASGMFEDILANPPKTNETSGQQQQLQQEEDNQKPHPSWLIAGDDRQLTTMYHFAVTFSLLSSITLLAILAKSLGDVIDLVGCSMGSLIGFVLPAAFSLKLDGYNHLAMVLLLVGSVIGLVGTYFSMRKLIVG